VLVRDVAYGQIPRAERAQRHLRTAEWIESLGRPEDHAEMVAHHYANALELVRAAGQSVGELTERTVRALREAGERALSLNALAQAENYYRQARVLAPDDAALLFQYGRVLYLQDEQGEDELREARARLLPEEAAEATLLLADIAWKQGRRQDMEAILQEAQSLVTDLPASRAQAAVLTERARYESVAGRIDSALELGLKALAMAEALGLDDLRLRALGTVATARGDMGDTRVFAHLDDLIDLCSERNQISELLRAWNNRTAMYTLYGNMEKRREGEAETLRLARQYGQLGQVRFIEGGGAIGTRFHAGEWDDAVARADKVIAEVEHGARLYQSHAMYAFRGLIRLARGDDQGAESDAEQAVERARRVGDSQALSPVLATASFMFASLGNKQRANELVTEALESMRPLRSLAFAVLHAPLLAWAALQLGREAEVVGVLEREPFKSPWLRAALAVASRDFRKAADILGGGGFKAFEAFFRLQASDERDVRSALDFYREVGATRYIVEAEAALAVKA
jgi:tetratricopeptide (TPR) repeat protein